MSENVEATFVQESLPKGFEGAPVDPPMTAAQAIRAFGLDWQVALSSVQAQMPEYGITPVVPGAKAVVRMDTKRPLKVVGSRYQLIQNERAFAFFDHLVESRRAVYERAGSCDGGRRVWIQAKLPGELWVTRQDQVEKYLLLSMLHGGGSLWVLPTPRRVACKNMLLRALAEGKSRAIRIRHVGDIEEKIKEAERLLDLTLGSFDNFALEAKAFAGHMIRKEALGAYFRSLVPDPKEGDSARAVATRETLVRLFESGKGNALPSVRGTLWSAVNAVVEFVDHERPTRLSGGEDRASSRFKSAQFGTGALLKERAWSSALALLG
jgi:phage/plasmid-like protein (TIGR03299 family)